ncbi:uncharacterized protein LOC106951161 [Poecilia latipinna]|uniref:uncharacterized protein LOC106951161 n=1 Tax=Poecilia latipinna TaxID=48699 RepID=UPI00072EA2CF|nr:PREDICTED: uncharacterized protein LOC106951161 [Poecilia latipinna]
MGNTNSCNSSLAEGPEEDEKYMLSRFPGSTVYMTKWKKKYGVEGKLKFEQWQIVVKTLENSVMGKRGRKKAKKEEELSSAKLWLKESENLFIRTKESTRNAVTVQGAQAPAATPPPTAAAAPSAPVSAAAVPAARLYPSLDEGAQDLYVFRPWTLEEARKAVEGITPAAEDPDIWVEDMTGLIHSYRLNGIEAGEAAMSSLGKDWAKVRGNYTGKITDQNGRLGPIKYPMGANPELSEAFKAQWDPLCERVKRNFRKKANYRHLAGIKQIAGEKVDDFRLRFEKEFKMHSGITFNEDDTSAYQQQLKNALLTGFRPEIGGWIRKHLVEIETVPVSQLTTWAIHAEKIFEKPNQGLDVFQLDEFGGLGTSAFFNGPMKGRRKSRDRGGRTRRRTKNDTPQNPRSPNGCWICGGTGHWARNCTLKNAARDNRRGGGVRRPQTGVILSMIRVYHTPKRQTTTPN